MNYINTIVARPLFYFLNGKDKLEPSIRYILRTSSWNGTVHKRTYSVFLTEPEHDGLIVSNKSLGVLVGSL